MIEAIFPYQSGGLRRVHQQVEADLRARGARYALWVTAEDLCGARREEVLRLARAAECLPVEVWSHSDVEGSLEAFDAIVVECALLGNACVGAFRRALASGKPIILVGSSLDALVSLARFDDELQ